ncbi:hypothetical protein VTK73DRAFT_386 [Phialemonium thermophilum]|uniref:Uncharacterized protein n=1 Tax=Phialemonium thermophilum TaxID=223376 RepID=A0ABR3VVD6_9PEZI
MQLTTQVYVVYIGSDREHKSHRNRAPTPAGPYPPNERDPAFLALLLAVHVQNSWLAAALPPSSIFTPSPSLNWSDAPISPHPSASSQGADGSNRTSTIFALGSTFQRDSLRRLTFRSDQREAGDHPRRSGLSRRPLV